MTRTYLPGILAMAAIVVASNILVQFLFGQWLTWGAFTYPFAFLVTDLMNRIYGASAARRVIFVGFLVGVICSLIWQTLSKFSTFSRHTLSIVCPNLILGISLSFYLFGNDARVLIKDKRVSLEKMNSTSM